MLFCTHSSYHNCMFMTIFERPMQSMLMCYYYCTCACDFGLQWYKDGVRACMPSYHEQCSPETR